jgi:hypothetical protein
MIGSSPRTEAVRAAKANAGRLSNPTVKFASKRFNNQHFVYARLVGVRHVASLAIAARPASSPVAEQLPGKPEKGRGRQTG